LGYDGFADNLQKYVPRAEKGRKPHNEYIDHLVNYGLVGILPFLLIFFHPLTFFLKRLSSLGSSPEYTAQQNMVGVGLSTIVPFMINNWFAGGLFSYWPVMMIYFTIVTMALRACAEHDHPSLLYGMVRTWPHTIV
jgi:O-antigen ligase